MPSSWYRCNGATLVVCDSVDEILCELKELLYHILLKVKAISARAAVVPQGSSPPGHTPTSYSCCRSLRWHGSLSYSAAAQYSLLCRQSPGPAEDRLLLSFDKEHIAQLLRYDCRYIGSGVSDNKAAVA